MKKQKVIFVISLVIIAVGLSGCFEENKSNQNKKFETVPLKDLGLKIGDLPSDYMQYYTGKRYLSVFSNQSSESIVTWFSKGNISNLKDSELVTCELNKFDTASDANQRYKITIDFLLSDQNYSIINESINRIGDESKDLSKEGFTDLLTFRISNIIVVMSSYNYSFTFNLAKIVEQRIYDNAF